MNNRSSSSRPLIETHKGILPIGDVQLPCSVLEGGTRVLSVTGIQTAFGIGFGGRKPDSGPAQMPRFMAREGLIKHIPEDLLDLLKTPIQYRPLHGGRSGKAYEATILPRLCAAIMDAGRDGQMKGSSEIILLRAEMLIKAFAQVAIIALVDEATGYQEERDPVALQRLLAAYLSEERLRWVKTFPDAFFTEIFRLRGWERSKDSNAMPMFVGRIINKIVYEQLPEGVLERLQSLNPIDPETHRRKARHHQHLSSDVGHPDLRAHIQQLLPILRLSDSWSDFQRNFARGMGKSDAIQRPLDFGD